MLVVDDQQAEIDAIEWLIEKNSLPLVVVQKNNGKSALQYLSEHKIDILFTDIRMPFMDGLELARRARELLPSLKIIIYSAYGEFEYAKKAIMLGAVHYILKPLEVKEFLSVINNVIMQCTNERLQKEQERLLIRGFQKGVEYEKEKVLHDLLQGCVLDDRFRERAAFAGLNMEAQRIQMILVKVRQKLFDTNYEEFKELLASILGRDVYFLNVDEHQSVLLFALDSSMDESIFHQELVAYSELLREGLKNRFERESLIIVGTAVDRIESLHMEFSRMEARLEYFFFIEGSAVCDNIRFYSGGTGSSLEPTLQSIYAMIDRGEYEALEQGVEFLIDSMRRSGSFSSIYAKLVFTGILKKIYESLGKNGLTLTEGLDPIVRCDSVIELKEVILSVVRDMKKSNECRTAESNRKAIEEVLRIIRTEYGSDIGLEYLANRVFLSPSYLSILLKKMTGKNFSKHITAVRMEKAQELLRNTTIKVVDIGNQVGYPNPSYFNLMFKQHYGMTPLQYRERSDSR